MAKTSRRNLRHSRKGSDTPCTALVVGASDYSLELLVEVLDLAGFDILVARTDLEALFLLVDHRVDVVIVDRSLKGGDGLYLTRQIRRNPEQKKLPVIVVSAYPFDQRTRGAGSEGFEGYITKPINVCTFAREILDLYRRRMSKEAVCRDGTTG